MNYKIIILVSIFLVPDKVLSHSGRTNSSGCHNDYQNGGYHCHRSDEYPIKDKEITNNELFSSVVVKEKILLINRLNIKIKSN